jgi:DNA-binding SARP family transcriptional activator/tetratricopeptide (TPR) repeat protein
MLRVQVLGTVDAQVDGGSIGLGAARPTLVLAMLALEDGRVVSRDRLIDAIWESDPPASATTQVAIHISHLRKALGDPDLIETAGHGYRLAAASSVDAPEAERMLAEARESQRPEMFRQALRMWRGPVLDGLDSSALVPVARRLEELFLSGVEDWAALELDIGGERELLDVLPDVVAANPLREGLRARLMEALWHSGRRADALKSFDEGRSVLVEELGLDPGEQLTRLQQRILQEDLVIPAARAPSGEIRDVDAEENAGGEPTFVVPRQLPMDVSRFSGRERAIADLASMFGTDPGQGGVVALHGPGGAGKTALAIHVAHRVADRFPDGQLFMNLRGHGTLEPLQPNAVLGSLLRGLGVADARIPEDEDDRGRMLRSLLMHKRMLMVLDNARDSFQIRPLLPGGANVVMVTTRSQLRSLATREGAGRVRVDELPPDDAVDMLRSKQSQASPTRWATPDMIELARLCGHLPLALAVAAERANRFPERPLTELNAELRDGRALDILTAWEDDPCTSVRAVFAWSYDALPANEARMFRLLGLHPHPSFDLHVAAALAGLELRETGRVLDRLVDDHLVAERRPGQYEMHDLVHAFAVDLARSLDGVERGASLDRMFAVYVQALYDGGLLIPLSLRQTTPPPRADIDARAFKDAQDFQEWFRETHVSLLAVFEEAATAPDHTYVCRMAASMGATLLNLGRYTEAEAITTRGQHYARLAGDNRFAGTLALQRVGLRREQGNLESALEASREAIAIFEQIGAKQRLLNAATAQALCLGDLGRPEEALLLLEEIRTKAPEEAARSGVFLNHLATTQLSLGRSAAAKTSADAAIDAARLAADPYLEAAATDTLATALEHEGDVAGAHLLSQRCIELLETMGRPVAMATALRTLGRLEQDLGLTVKAHATWTRALTLLNDLEADGSEVGREELRRLLGALDQAAVRRR